MGDSTDGKVFIEECKAGDDGGGIFTLTTVSFFASVSDGSDGGAATVIEGNSAGGDGGGIAAWAPLNVAFGHVLVSHTHPCAAQVHYTCPGSDTTQVISHMGESGKQWFAKVRKVYIAVFHAYTRLKSKSQRQWPAFIFVSDQRP